MNSIEHIPELPVQVHGMEGLACWAAGLMGERDLWSVLAAVADVLKPYHAQGMAHGSITADRVAVMPDGFVLLAAREGKADASPEDDVWQTGALVYCLALGLEVFGGHGHSWQTEDTPLPIIRNEWPDLSRCVKDMLSYRPDERPSMEQLAEVAHEHLSQVWPAHPARRAVPAEATGSTADEWEKLWPDEF